LIVLGYSVPAAVAFRRIREKWKAEDQIRFLAMHDPLTGLPNRVQLKNRLDQALTRAKRRGSMLTIMCVDLDRFKEVNDTLGHNAGDALLREASDRLRDCVRDTDIVARLGGDEFVVVAEDLDQPSDAIPLAQRICEELGKNFDIEGQEMAISGSVGITTAPAEGADTQTLLNNADLALYRAKSDGRNTFRFFEPEMDQAIQYRRAMANDLRLALRNNELHIDYQPQFDLETGRLTGYEALARWIHKSKGNIPPGEFIPIAEESGLICTLGEWVLETASAYARHWPDETKLSVNISPVQFLTQDLAAMVRDVLAKTGFPPQRLLLEFKENLLFRNTEETIRTLQELTRMGVLLALDDFGTGYSSLSYLTRLPVSKIKIDRSFICQMENDKNISAIVNTIIGLGKSLNVTIAAEGVETEAQARHLRNVGCDEAQGFLFGRPASAIQKERPGEINMPVVLDTELHEIPHKEPAEPASELSQLLPPSPDELKELGRQMREKEEGADAGSSAKVTPLRRDGGELAG
jgi:diguanylate cyclase (GGDEF)-like protein